MRANASKAVLALVAIAMLALPSTALASGASVSSIPALSPGFAKSITDYTTTCPAGKVSVTTNVPRGLAFRLDGKTVKSGGRTSSVALSPGQRFQFVSGSGKSAVAYSVRCLPADFPKLTPTGKLPSSASFIALSIPEITGPVVPYAFVVDSRGVPLWWKHTPGLTPIDVKAMKGGRIGFWTGTIVGDINDGGFNIYNLDGSLHRVVNTVGIPGDLHETLESASGNIYRASFLGRDHADLTSIAGASDSEVFDGAIQELDPSGHVVWSWNSKDHIAPAESRRWFDFLKIVKPRQRFDLAHLNSMEEDGLGGLIVSLRHTDAVFRIRKSDGSVDWKLGGTKTGESLTVLGDEAYGDNHFGGQHDARLQADGTITVYDNGSALSRPPRATRWRINMTARTATLVEDLRDPTIRSSLCCGGARRFADGSWLVSWATQPYVRAYGPDHKVKFNLSFSGTSLSYRAAPIQTSQMTRAQLIAGMDKQYPR